MKTMTIGKSGITASRMTLGTLPIGGESVWGGADDRESLETILRARDIGVSLFDTAPAYGFGRSERLMGQAMRGRRAEFILATKCGVVWDHSSTDLLYSRDGHDLYRDLTAASIERELEQSLQRLQTDYIDLYMIHWPASPRFPVPAEETMGKLMQMKKAGKIRAVGASNVTLEQLTEYCRYGEIDLIQNRFSMLDQKAYRAMNQFCLERGIAFQAYSPFERGLLTGAVGMDLQVQPGDARSGIKWYQPKLRRAVLDMLSGWKPLCEKYGCTQAALTLAWMLAQADNINVNVGSRKVRSIEQSAAGACMELDQTDAEAMSRDIQRLLEAPVPEREGGAV